MRDFVHELIGDKKYVGPLLQAALAKAEKSLRVQQPLGSPLTEEIEHWLGPAQKSALAFFKVLNLEAFIKWLNQAAVLPMGVRIDMITHDSAPSSFVLRNSKGIFFESNDSAHLLQLFFGPWEVCEMEGLHPLLTSSLAGSRLAPFYFWGLDSV